MEKGLCVGDEILVGGDLTHLGENNFVLKNPTVVIASDM